MNPFVFFVGCPRSGTTLLRRMADSHAALAVIHQTRWIARTWDFRRGLTAEGFVTRRLLERLNEPRRLRRLEMESSDLERLLDADRPTPYAAFVTRLFDLYGERHDKRLVGDKSPGYARYLPLLHGLWPRAKYVHIVRDGRDVCLSVLDWGKGPTGFRTFRDDPFTTCGVWWEWYVRLGREGGSEVGPGLYHELRYEALVAEPERESEQLCAFLALPYDESMLRFHEGRTRPEPGLSSKAAWLPVTGGLRDWRASMDPDGLERFESAAGDLLEELGYERGAMSVSTTARDRAERVRERFVEQLVAGRWPLPRAWSTAAQREAERVPG